MRWANIPRPILAILMVAVALALISVGSAQAAAAEPTVGPEPEVGPPPAAGESSRAESPGPGLLEITPAGGLLGEKPLFALRGSYTISQQAAIEAEIGHNVGDFVSAYLHSAGLRMELVRHRGHIAFATLGFGTFSAAGGDAIAAQSISRTDLRLGAGIVIKLRDDVGVRLDLRHHRFLLGGGRGDQGSTLGANEISLGLKFSRRIWSAPASSGRSAS